MAVLKSEDMADLVAGTLRHLGKMNYQQIAQSQQSYEIFERWFKNDKVTLDSGYGIQRTLMNRLPTSAAHVGIGEVDNVTIVDLLDQLQIPWCHAKQSWGVIYQETLMNRGESLITNIIKPRREGAMLNLIEEIEEKAWATPAAPTANEYKKNPLGILYWIVKNSATGFNGGAPTNHTAVAGVSLTDSPTFKNYTGTYALTGGMTKQDAIKKIKTALRKCKFKSPVPGNDYTKSPGRYCMYVNETTFSSMEDIGESQNENLGKDIAASQFDVGSLAMRGFPIRWVVALDADTQNPVYGIDHSTMQVVGLKGDWFRESQNTAPLQHDTVQYFIDLTYNYLCLDRRRNFVLYGA